MSSILSYLWSAASSSVASAPAVNSNNESKSDEEKKTNALPIDFVNEYVMIDTPSGDMKSTPTHSRQDSWEVDETPTVEEPTMPSPANIDTVITARTCRLYGAAHKPPRLYAPNASSSSPAPSFTSPSSSSSGSLKRKTFADALKSSPSSEPLDGQTIPFAQSGEASIADQLLAKIAQLEQAQAAVEPLIASSDEATIARVFEEVNTASPPLNPISARLYDESTSWALSIDEPNSKRSKRSSSSTVIDATGGSKCDSTFSNSSTKHSTGAKRKSKSRIVALGRSLARDDKLMLD